MPETQLMSRVLASLLAVGLLAHTLSAPVRSQTIGPPDEAPSDVDALMATMSPRDKVGQLFMLSFTGRLAEGASAAIAELRAGGIVLIANAASASEARTMTASLQAQAASSGVQPLLIGINQEGGRIQPLSTGLTQFG